jgi:hypothetical protein
MPSPASAVDVHKIPASKNAEKILFLMVEPPD